MQKQEKITYQYSTFYQYTYILDKEKQSLYLSGIFFLQGPRISKIAYLWFHIYGQYWRIKKSQLVRQSRYIRQSGQTVAVDILLFRGENIVLQLTYITGSQISVDQREEGEEEEMREMNLVINDLYPSYWNE